MSNLINQLKNDFRAGTLTGMASAIGENATRTQIALGAVLPGTSGRSREEGIHNRRSQ